MTSTEPPTRSGEKAIDFQRGESADDLLVNATTDSADRALSPLVENALQHAARHVNLTVEEGARTVDITVSDDGSGLPQKDDPEELFAAGARTVDSTGAGLGLALARRVARTLGGDVTVTSQRDPTSFTLTLPRP